MPDIDQLISHYRIVEKIGQGGMGEVYLADDTTLDRKVALKFLPEAFTSDPERMARFEREAKLLASLNHPNIAGIYGLEQAEGNRFLVLEYVEGETLQARLNKGALQLEDALILCRQITEGLEAAHEKGVIHRDLKPANVMITSEEKVKILDFGLAKALSDETQSIDSSQSPTLTEAMTQPGVILGTAAYMSPEQAKGKSVDKRADIWAFGCILYECLTGKKVFEGETVTETLAAVIRGEPDWDALPVSTPQNIRFVLRRCLEKERSRRFRDIADVQIEIDEVRRPFDATTPMKPRISRLSWSVAVFAVLIALALAFLYFGSRKPAEAMYFHISVPAMPNHSSLTVSPDGGMVAFTAAIESTTFLFVCKVGSITATKLEGTEGARDPFWSPDSRSIGFFAGGKLKKIDVSGGPPQEICAANGQSGGTWNSDGIILYSNGSEPLYSVPETGGEPAAVRPLNESDQEVGHVYPFFLPDGRHFLYSIRFNVASKNGVFVGSLDSPDKKQLLEQMSWAEYVEPGYLLFMHEDTLFAQRFDTDTLSLSGQKYHIADDIISDQYGRGAFSASRDNLIYCAGEADSRLQFLWIDRSGKELESVYEPGNYIADFDLSPDERYIAYLPIDPTSSYDLWLFDLTRNVSDRFTDNQAVEWSPRWSPDGERIAFQIWQEGNPDLAAKKVGVIDTLEVLLESPDREFMQSWSKDMKYIAYVKVTGSTSKIFILPLNDKKDSFPIYDSPGDQYNAEFSYNGKWIAFCSNETGRSEIYIISFPSLDQVRRISSNGGVQPQWRGDDREIYYLGLDGKLNAVDINADDEINLGMSYVLFDPEIPISLDTWDRQYKAIPDGKRFLFLKPLKDPESIPITVVLNWKKLLEQ